MAPRLKLLISSGSRKKDPMYPRLSAVRALHSHKMWAEVSSLTPHFLHNGLSSKPIRWRCLRRVVWPVRRPVTTLDWYRLKDKSLILVPGQGPEKCAPTKSNVYLTNSLATVVSYPDLHTFLTFHRPNLTSLSQFLSCAKASIQAWGNCECFVTWQLLMMMSC
jgi:hypothetical protein